MGDKCDDVIGDTCADVMGDVNLVLGINELCMQFNISFILHGLKIIIQI